MSKRLSNIIRFVVLLAFQLLIVDNVRVGNYVHPCIYILFVMMLPLDMPKINVLLCGFIMGFAIDLFTGTFGLNAAATTFIAFMRPWIIGLVTSGRNVENVSVPSIAEVGAVWFIRYSVVLILLHNVVLFFLETFSFKLIGETLIRILLSTLISEVLILLIVLLFNKEKKR